MTVKVHVLKTDPLVFDANYRGIRHAEIRLNDRDFQTGDFLFLRETSLSGIMLQMGADLVYTGRHMLVEITHVQVGYGLQSGWVILSFQPVPCTDEALDMLLNSDAAYQEYEDNLSPYERRLLVETEDLARKNQKLQAFIASAAFSDLPGDDRYLLTTQDSQQKALLSTLHARVAKIS